MRNEYSKNTHCCCRKEIHVLLKNTLHVSDLLNNLGPIIKITNPRFRVNFENDRSVSTSNEGMKNFVAHRIGNLY